MAKILFTPSLILISFVKKSPEFTSIFFISESFRKIFTEPETWKLCGLIRPGVRGEHGAVLATGDAEFRPVDHNCVGVGNESDTRTLAVCRRTTYNV